MGQKTTLSPADIDELIEHAAYEQARSALSTIETDDESFTITRIKLGLRDGSLPPGVAMQRLVQIMRKDATAPGAKTLYQEASKLSFQEGASSTAHSHPPPPVTSDKK
ncbi:MAG: hypothetical protein SFV15_03510 [Polyangiaceae bacterium]|nr:hypothetical protein [Polyangiaceae bacterium]